ncbi:MAG: hypothetical protein KDB05_13765 [Planctomycetales bacterium]|nr:hypothetical protein [Planctomycetales bacterium]
MTDSDSRVGKPPADPAQALSNKAVLNCHLHTSVPDWVIDHPESMAVFKELGIATSCEGKSLEYVCRQQALDPQNVLDRLLRVISN